MPILETAIKDYAYRIEYEIRDESVGTHLKYQAFITAVLMWCPISDQWLPVDLDQISNMDRLYERLDTTEFLRGK